MQKKSLQLRLLVCLVFVVCLLFTGVAGPAFAVPRGGAPSDVSGLREKLRVVLEARAKELRVPGGIIHVESARTGTWTSTFGTSDLATGAPVSTDMHFRIGSITKTFIGTVMLQLIEEGKLKLDDPIGKFRPEVPNGENITIRQLLDMRSGLFNYSEDDEFSDILTDEINGTITNKVWEPSELLKFAFKHPPYFAPGQGFHYSNTNTILLGLLIEQLTGNAPQNEVKKRIFTPLGMSHSVMPEREVSTLPTPYSQGYTFNLQPGQTAPASQAPTNATFINPSWAWTAGNAISTLDDLKIWSKVLAKGTLISPELEKQRLDVYNIGITKPFPIGYGLAIADFGGFIGHNGELPGYQSFMAYNPKLDATIIILTNIAPAADNSGPADTLAKIAAETLEGQPLPEVPIDNTR